MRQDDVKRLQMAAEEWQKAIARRAEVGEALEEAQRRVYRLQSELEEAHETEHKAFLTLCQWRGDHTAAQVAQEVA